MDVSILQKYIHKHTTMSLKSYAKSHKSTSFHKWQGDSFNPDHGFSKLKALGC